MSTDTIDTKALDNAADTFSRSMRALNSMELADLPPELDQDARDLARIIQEHGKRIIQEHGKDYADTAYDDMTAPLLEALARLVQAAKAADRLAALEAENSRLQAGIQMYKADYEYGLNGLKHEYAKLKADNARLREALAPLANSHTDNEGTDRPVWWILDPQQMMRACPHRLYSMFHGPFWSREEAERFFKATRYRYGSRAVVYCGSAHTSPQMRELFDCSAALAAGGDQ